MVCEELDQLEWDFIQARAGSLDIDSFGWTNREFSCLDAILVHNGRGIRANAAPVQLRAVSKCYNGPAARGESALGKCSAS